MQRFWRAWSPNCSPDRQADAPSNSARRKRNSSNPWPVTAEVNNTSKPTPPADTPPSEEPEFPNTKFQTPLSALLPSTISGAFGLVSRTSSSRSLSSSVTPSAASRTKQITSALATAARAALSAATASESADPAKPAASWQIATCPPGSDSGAPRTSRVVPARAETIARSSPVSAFSRELLPTLGLPARTAHG